MQDLPKNRIELMNAINHKFRTPLTVILGNTPLLQNPEELPSPEEIAEIAKDIEQAGKSLLNLVDKLLETYKEPG